MQSVLGATQDHYRRLKLVEGEISAWEDGLRTNPSERSFEWWYFDCALDDGSKLTVEFHTKPPHLSPSQPLTPFVSLTLDRIDGTNVSRALTAAPEEFAAAQDHCDVRIGSNTFSGDLHRYEIHVDIDGVVAHLTLSSEVPPWRPATGHVFFGEHEQHYVAWLPVVPRGAVSGSLSIDGQQTLLAGIGYHDHNWGNAPLRKLIDHWYWGRARIGDYTIVTLNFISHSDHGKNCHPAFMLAKAGQIIAAGEHDIEFTAADVRPHESSGVPVANSLTYRYRRDESSYSVRFDREHNIFDLDFGQVGAYHRFTGAVTLEHRIDDELIERVTSDALWELLYFGARTAVSAAAPAPAVVAG